MIGKAAEAGTPLLPVLLPSGGMLGTSDEPAGRVFFFFLIYFLAVHRHMEVPGAGIEPKPQQ